MTTSYNLTKVNKDGSEARATVSIQKNGFDKTGNQKYSVYLNESNGRFSKKVRMQNNNTLNAFFSKMGNLVDRGYSVVA